VEGGLSGLTFQFASNGSSYPRNVLSLAHSLPLGNCAWLNQRRYICLPAAVLALACTTLCQSLPPGKQNLPTSSRYEFRQEHDPDGIGKFYMGREIAKVMGHEGANWLERPERDSEEAPGLLVRELRIKPADVVADIGAGTGYLTRRLAPRAAKVLAVDIQREMLERLTNALSIAGITNVVPVLGSVTNPSLPSGSVDLVVMVDVYHEFEFPFEMMDRICEALRPGGRVAFVEYRAQDRNVPIKPLHKMTEAQVRREMTPHPLRWTETLSLPWQHIILFTKTEPGSA
jgi:SAM-dependent methyltransferase